MSEANPTAEATNYLSQALSDLGVIGNEPIPEGAITQPVPLAKQVVEPAPVAEAKQTLSGLAAAAMSAATGTKLETTKPETTPVEEEAAETEPEDPIPPEAAATEKSRSAWTGVKRENKELKAKLAQLESKLKTGDPEADQKVQALTEQIAEYENKLGRLDLTQSKTFKDKYEKPIDNLRNRSIQVLMRYTDRTAEDAKAFVNALESADPKDVQNALAEEPQAVSGALLQNLIEMQEASSVKDRALSDWKNTKSAVAISGSKDEEAEALRQVVAQTSDAVHTLSATPEEGGEGSWLLAEQPDNPQWQEQRQKIISAARAALRDKTEVPKLVLEGVAAAVYRKLAEQLYQQVTELSNSLSSRDRVRPKFTGQPPQKRSAPVVMSPSDPAGFVDSLMEM